MQYNTFTVCPYIVYYTAHYSFVQINDLFLVFILIYDCNRASLIFMHSLQVTRTRKVIQRFQVHAKLHFKNLLEQLNFQWQNWLFANLIYLHLTDIQGINYISSFMSINFQIVFYFIMNKYGPALSSESLYFASVYILLL